MPKACHDPVAIRTVVISGLPQALDAKQLWKKVRKYEGAEKVEWPHKLEDTTEDPSVGTPSSFFFILFPQSIRPLAHVLFSTPAAANNAVTKLHAHVFKGSLLSVTLKKRLENLAKPANAIKSKIKPTEGDSKAPAVLAPSHASRLIVRNLPFNITEQDLRAVFLPYGPIYQIHIPTVEVSAGEVKSEDEGGVAKGKPQTRAKGFAFVWMLSKKDAERAIEGCNGKLVRAGTAEAIVSDKQKKKKQKRLEKKLKEAGKIKEEDVGADDEGGGEEDGEEDEKKASERVIAVDWALSKDKWEEEKAKIEQQTGEDIEMADAGSDDEGDEDEEDEGESEDEEENIGVHTEEDEHSASSGDESDEDDREEPVKPQLPPPEVGTTLFIRNVPFNATEDELRTLFRAFGPLRYARITMDPETGRSRGTGFACFWNKEDADKVIEQSDLLRKETTGSAPAVCRLISFYFSAVSFAPACQEKPIRSAFHPNTGSVFKLSPKLSIAWSDTRCSEGCDPRSGI